MGIKVRDIFILILVISILSYVAITIKDNIKQQEVINSTKLNNDYNPNLDTLVELKDQSNDTNKNDINKKDDSKKDVIVIKNGSIAVIDIPDINVRAQVKIGTDDETLKNYVGKFSDSANFGEIGNPSLAAHNNVYTEIFRNLNKLNIGNKVRIVTKDYEYVYKVVWKKIVSPTDIYVLESSNKKELTLITCTTTAKSRVIIRCEQILQNPI